MDHFTNSALNYFTATPVNRLAEKRTDMAWIEEQLRSETSRFLPLWQGKNLLAKEGLPSPVALNYDAYQVLEDTEAPILLGEVDGLTYFAVALNTLSDDLEEFGDWKEIRYEAALISEAESSLAIISKALVHWHKQHKYCGACGSETQSKQAGYMRQCSNESCNQKHFPRTDPAIIVLVHTDLKCLLARQPSWDAGRYSTLAGFVEPGESLEDAVVREVHEESNIKVGRVFYQSSQPWPFPSSLMLGYLAEAESTDIQLLDQELEHAAWFSKVELVDALHKGTLKLPPEITISYNLIETWFDRDHSETLKDVLSTI